jgi:DNA (cytosine-5)-methyltransferase 1
MLTHDNGKTWEVIKNTFKELNYNIYIKDDPILNAKDYGMPQNRPRLFIVGIRNNIKLKKEFKFPSKINLKKTTFDFLDKEVDSKYYLGKKGFEFVTTHPSRAQVNGNIMRCQKANQQFNWNGDFIFEPLDKVKNNKKIMSKAYVGEWNGQIGVTRKLTPRECLRLMGFSDKFKIVVNDQNMYKQAGNSIVINVLEALVNSIIETGVFK